MLKILIADGSEPFTDALTEVLKKDFELKICHDGETALELLLSYEPDILILNFMLPYKDGLTLLQQSAHKPKIILAISPYVNPYIEQTAANLGVQYIMIMPKVDALRVRLLDMIASDLSPREEPKSQVMVHLHILNFFTHLDGYHQLCVGIPLFLQNPGMRLSKELYPVIADHFGLPDARTVEHSIRKAITAAWDRKNPTVWEKYFPGCKACPTNKAFISRLAEMLKI